MEDQLTPVERELLLKFARQAIEAAVNGEKLLPLDSQSLPPRLQAPGATFVTLTKHGELRGCIGTLEAYLPLAEDVRDHAMAAALQDFRFPPVQPQEVPELNIEISRLTNPQAVEYDSPRDLITKLRPQIDGVVIRDGFHRATFLPQVWEKVADPVEFLNHLCLKMGAPPDLWQIKKLKVFTYQVEEFHE